MILWNWGPKTSYLPCQFEVKVLRTRGIEPASLPQDKIVVPD